MITGWIFLTTGARQNTVLNNKHISNALLFLLFCLLGAGVYLLDMYATSDLPVYISQFWSYSSMSLKTALSASNNELLFVFTQWIVAQFTDSSGVFQLVIWLIFSLVFVKALRNIFTANETLYVFFSYTNYFVFFSVMNTMRQGIAVALLTLAISSIVSKSSKNLTFYLAVVIAPLFHLTSLPLSVLLFIYKKFRFSLKAITIYWSLCAVLFVTHLNSKLLSGINIDFIVKYSSEERISYYGSVNRLDFLLFSVFWIVLIYIMYKKTRVANDSFEQLLKIYMIFNTYFLLFGFIAYSDRLASFSWSLIPILVWKVISQTSNFRQKATILLLIFLIVGIYTNNMGLIL